MLERIRVSMLECNRGNRLFHVEENPTLLHGAQIKWSIYNSIRH